MRATDEGLYLGLAGEPGHYCAMTEPASTNKTHYEVLRIDTKASGEDVRTAYRLMCRRFHPDRHPRHPEAAARLMASINVAYDTLSDPRRRADYDTWLRSGRSPEPIRAPAPARAQAYRERTHTPDPAPFFGTGRAPAADAGERRRARAVTRLMAASALCCLVGLALGAWMLLVPQAATPGTDVARIVQAYEQRNRLSGSYAGGEVATSPTALGESNSGAPVHIRPLESPNGNPWPDASGELKGFVRRFNDGEAQILLDNRLGRSDVFAKVFSATEDGLVAARHVFVRTGDRMALDRLRPGEYEVRFLVLDTGVTLRSERVVVADTGAGAPPAPVRLDNIEGRNGRMTPIPRDEFQTPALKLQLSHEPSVR